MLEIEFDFDTEGAEQEEAFLDAYEVSMLFEQTRQEMTAGLNRQLEGVLCDEHQQAPRIKITGRYDHDNEEMDLNYHVDTCCKMFLVRVVKILNNA